MMSDKLEPIELKDEFAKMSKEDISDFRFLSRFIFNKVGLFLSKQRLRIKNYDQLTCFGGLQCIQYPDELAKLLIFLYQHKISSFCEMGVAFGGTFFVIDSFLRAVNPEMKYSLAINSYSDRSFKKKLEVYQKEHPEVTFLEMDAREFIPDKKYDFCFIDYEHTAENCRISYNAMKKYSNFIGFHDIKYRRYPDVVKFWDEEVAGDKVELLNEDPIFPEPIGIGIVTNFA